MDRTAQFVQALTASQSRLYAYICTLLGGSSGSADVLQETNLVLWAKADEFDASRPFLPWALRFAQLQVMAHRKKTARSRLIFDDELVRQLTREHDISAANEDRRLEALEECLGKLPEQQRRLVRDRYEEPALDAGLARKPAADANALAASLYRIRKALAKCIEARLAMEGA